MAISKMCVIWMHGLGDEGRSWTFLDDEIKIPSLKKPIVWKFPDAPKAAVTCNGGYKMTSWFDIEDIPITVDAKDYPGDIESSVRRIHALIGEAEAVGFDSKEIFVGGFSQGGALSMMSVLQYPRPLGGVVCLSGWLMMRQALPSLIQPANARTPVFWGHGDRDNIVDYSLQGVGAAALRAAGVPVSLYTCQGTQHSSTPAELKQVQAFLASCAAGSAPGAAAQ